MGLFDIAAKLVMPIPAVRNAVTDLFKKPEVQQPDYAGLANQQYAANKDAARFNAMSGNPWFSNPYGTQQVDWSGAKTGLNYNVLTVNAVDLQTNWVI